MQGLTDDVDEGRAVIGQGRRQRRLAAAGGATYRLTTDLHLAALSVEHGLVVMTEDRDFARFEGVSWERPLGG